MSLQDDAFDLEAYFKAEVKRTKKGTKARKLAEATAAAYDRIWDAFIDLENEYDKVKPVADAAKRLVRYAIDMDKA